LVWPKGRPDAAPFALDRTGRIYQIADGQAHEVLDISGEVAAVSESGALGLALHPRFEDGSGPTPYAFVWYNARGSPNNMHRLSRFGWNAASRSFDPGSELVLVEEQETHLEHNAGRVAFGPDGFLYFANGDDLNSDNHQTLGRALFAGIFRIDVDSI